MAKTITIMDGGMGRHLKRIGAPFQQPEWSALALMEAPDMVLQAHKDFIEAGAEIIITNSYAVVPFHIGQDRFDEQGYELIELAAQLARQAADEAPHDVKVAASIPPAFGSYQPENFDPQKADDIYNTHIKSQEKYADIWLAETVSSIIEAKTIANLINTHNKPIWISYSVKDRFDSDEKPCLRSGENIDDAISEAKKLGANTILFNCSQPEEMSPALKIAKNTAPDITFGVYANSFDKAENSRAANGVLSQIRPDMEAKNYLSYARQWVNDGATIIGGCCGIFPEHIAHLKQLNH